MSDSIDTGKRRFLTAAASVVGGAGAVAVAIPFVSSIAPSAKAEAAGAPVQIDISQLEPGQLLSCAIHRVNKPSNLNMRRTKHARSEKKLWSWWEYVHIWVAHQPTVQK